MTNFWSFYTNIVVIFLRHLFQNHEIEPQLSPDIIWFTSEHMLFRHRQTYTTLVIWNAVTGSCVSPHTLTEQNLTGTLCHSAYRLSFVFGTEAVFFLLSPGPSCFFSLAVWLKKNTVFGLALCLCRHLESEKHTSRGCKRKPLLITPTRIYTSVHTFQIITVKPLTCVSFSFFSQRGVRG